MHPLTLAVLATATVAACCVLRSTIVHVVCYLAWLRWAGKQITQHGIDKALPIVEATPPCRITERPAPRPAVITTLPQRATTK